MKKRLDEVLVEQGLAENRSKAKLYISGQKEVYVNDKLVSKAGFSIGENDVIKIVEKEKEFVSRSGLKLHKAVEGWKIDLRNKVCLDIGASTGGFTEVCLDSGAKLVYSLDVGFNQLHLKLKTDPRVINIEKFNFRNAVKSDFNQPIDFFCCDVSFISIEKMLIPLNHIIADGITGVILIKPQFESEYEEVKNGRINSKEIHIKDIYKVIKYANNNGFNVTQIDFSPIKGNKKQNIEYLAYLTKTNAKPFVWEEHVVKMIVEAAWRYSQ